MRQLGEALMSEDERMAKARKKERLDRAIEQQGARSVSGGAGACVLLCCRALTFRSTCKLPLNGEGFDRLG